MKKPEFTQLTYADSGVYVCQASVKGLVRKQSFELTVEGQRTICPFASETFEWLIVFYVEHG